MSDKTEQKSMSGLTPKEKRVAMLLINGKSRNEIARVLGTSENTVKTHAQKIFKKTQVKSQKELMIKFLITPEDE